MTRRAGFVVDLQRCTGCSACVVACRLEHGWPSSAPWRRVVALNARRYPNGPTWFVSLACHHCESPQCAKACPSGAYEQRRDGLVLHHEQLCLGCRYCEMACPFGAPHYDEGARVTRKCDFCRSRVDNGEMPACVAACPTRALKILDADQQGEEAIPGFADVAHSRPAIRFKLPRGLRGARLRAFEEQTSERPLP